MPPRKRLRELYGAGPLHLLALLASFAIAAAAVVGWFHRPREVVNVLEWFAAAIVIHDLVLLPLYSLLDRIAFGRLPAPSERPRGSALVSAVNLTPYLRIPAILSGLLLAVFFPVILGLGAQTELAASGIAERGYLARWLLATGVMFAVSGIAYAMAVSRTRTPPESVAAELQQTTPKIEQMAVEPEQVTAKPRQAGVEPQQAGVESEQAGVEPEQAGVEPEQTAAAPKFTGAEQTPSSDVAATAPSPTAPKNAGGPEPDQG